MYCPKCGQQNPDNALFCEKCGTDLRAAPVQSSPSMSAGPSAAQTSSSMPAGPSTPFPSGFDIRATINRAIALAKNPAAFMNANKDQDPTLNQLMIYYIVPLALIPFVATLIGDLWYYGAFLRFSYGYGVLSAILGLIFNIIMVYVVGFITWKLAPSFGTNTTQIRALVLTAYAFTPYFLISALDIIPPIAFITLLGTLYGLYIVYLGLPILLNTPKDREITFIIVLIIVLFVVAVIIGAITGAIVDAAFLAHYGYV